MSALKLALPEGHQPSAHLSLELIPTDSLKLLNLVLTNACKMNLSPAEAASKYHKVKLTGKAGTTLSSSSLAMTILEKAGWATVGEYLQLQSAESLGGWQKKVAERWADVSAPRPAVASAPTPATPPAALSLRQQASRAKEEAERAERLAAMKAKAKKRGATKTHSMRADARRVVEEAEKKMADESGTNKDVRLERSDE